MPKSRNDKTVVERRTDTQVYRSGMKFSTKVWVVVGIFIVVGVISHFIF